MLQELAGEICMMGGDCEQLFIDLAKTQGLGGRRRTADHRVKKGRVMSTVGDHGPEQRIQQLTHGRPRRRKDATERVIEGNPYRRSGCEAQPGRGWEMGGGHRYRVCLTGE